MSAGGGSGRLPVWVDVGLIPLINLVLALIVSGLVVITIGADPLQAVQVLVTGAFGYEEGIGYSLYYATNFVFTGLAVAVAFHCGLFNIGGEGQAMLGGLGIALVALAFDAYLPALLLVPLCIVGAAVWGADWALIPAYLQAYRGSHIVITTIMFNFIAASLMVYLLVNVMIVPGSMSPETRRFEPGATLPYMHEMLAWFGIDVARSPLNASILVAVLACVFVWTLIWRTRWGYEIRAVGESESAARYAGIRPPRVILFAMAISGALAGLMALNEIMGVQHRLLLDFTAGYGFTGIAVSLMGRNHPIGIVLASLLFGALYQGGSELAFEMPNVTRELVVVIQGLVILFSGALAFMLRGPLERLFLRARRAKAAEQAA